MSHMLDETLIQTASLKSVASVVALFPNEEHHQVLGIETSARLLTGIQGIS